MMTVAIVFMIFWIFMSVFIGSIFVLIASANPGFSFAWVIPVLLLLFGYAMMTMGFSSESVKSKQFLKELFEGNEGSEVK